MFSKFVQHGGANDLESGVSIKYARFLETKPVMAAINSEFGFSSVLRMKEII